MVCFQSWGLGVLGCTPNSFDRDSLLRSGEVQAGEGIYGLQRSIQLAGARAVLTSLWRVDDTATQLLMTEFYGRWLAQVEP